MSHGILVIKITRWVGIGWREGDQPKPCLDDISCGLGPLCAKWILNTVRKQLQIFSVPISPDSGFFYFFCFSRKYSTQSVYSVYGASQVGFFHPYVLKSHTCMDSPYMSISITERLHFLKQTVHHSSWTVHESTTKSQFYTSWFVHGRSEVVHTDSPRPYTRTIRM